MTNQKQENISALMDGELDPGIYPHLGKDDEFKACWHRYHMISDIMHQQTPVHNNLPLSQRISQAIQQEPAIIAPSNRSTNRYIRPLAGFAVAATVAAIAILGIQRYGISEQQLINPGTEISQQSNGPSNLEFGVPVQGPNPAAIQQVQLKIQTDPRISSYILNHNEYQSRIGQPGVTPVSIFIEESANEPVLNSGSVNIDGVNVYSRVSNGVKVTVVGEVSDPTVKQIVDSVISNRK